MSALSLATPASAAFVQQGEKLTGTEEVARGSFGSAVAISADGNTALIGAEGDNGHVGAAWVFTRSGTTWTQQAKLTGIGESGSGAFGNSVALSADGSTALIGGSEDSHGVGAAWVFTRTGSTWTQQGGKLGLAGRHRRRSAIGSSVGLSADGNTALIGAHLDRNGHGAAWVFTRVGSVWTHQGSKLTGSGEQRRGEVGASVALSADGNTALIGGPGDHHSEGAAWVFTRASGAWRQQGSKLTGVCHWERESTGFRGRFGLSVALSADGNTALIGQPLCGVFNCVGPHCFYAGSAYVFTRSDSAWTEQGESFRQHEGEGGFGDSLALSADANTALIAIAGACSEGVFCGFAGRAWAFVASGATWTQLGEQITGSGEVEGGPFTSVGFGTSVALSSDAKTALIGGPGDDKGLGAAWVFVQ
jgi:hypothetical protein